MTKLELSREKINEIDEKIIKLFQDRLEIVQEVALYKKENNLPILDSKREKVVLEANLKLVKNDEVKEYVELFLNNMMDISKKYQCELLKK